MDRWTPTHLTYWHGEYNLEDGSTVGPTRNGNRDRLRARRQMFTQLVYAIGGIRHRSVLDVGCGDGYFSFAAESLGASPVTSVDSNQDEIAKATWIGQRLAGGSSGVEFRTGDVLDPRARIPCADVVVCFGLIYHFYDHMALFERLYHLCRYALLVDTDVIPLDQPILRLEVEGRRSWNRSIRPTLVPSIAALQIVAHQAGFRGIVRVPQYGAAAPVDYRSGRRAMLAFTRKERDIDALNAQVRRATRPADDGVSSPFSFHYRLGNVSYRLLRVFSNMTERFVSRW